MAAGDHVVADVGWVRVGERMGRGRRGSRWIFLDGSLVGLLGGMGWAGVS